MTVNGMDTQTIFGQRKSAIISYKICYLWSNYVLFKMVKFLLLILQLNNG